jgi:PRC-barrel domain
MRVTRRSLLLGLTLTASVAPLAAQDHAPVRMAQAVHGMAPAAPMPTEAEARMQRRFPQPVRVGDLIGLPVLDDNDSTLGHVRQVVRSPDGKIRLIVSYGGWLGGWLNWGGRPVAVPIELVGILGRQIAAIDMPRKEFAAAPTWATSGAADGDQPILAGETIRIALTRR